MGGYVQASDVFLILPKLSYPGKNSQFKFGANHGNPPARSFDLNEEKIKMSAEALRVVCACRYKTKINCEIQSEPKQTI